ncbi:15509_t:CDS:2 [Funneliformis mosseae]|uniref:15509_t:CDS:1 n=1 Tax=Funneliformis mosseae TaxID=27381 RepID=A0A9N9CTL0_FUNMO|nr:15509_t:CDS:2 [Funneliformis mosseae]
MTINNGIVNTINRFIAESLKRDFPDLQLNDQERSHISSKHTVSNDDSELLDEEPNKSSDLQPEEDGEFDEDKFLKELITVKKVINPIVEKLLKYSKGIARYKIIFLPKDNKQDPQYNQENDDIYNNFSLGKSKNN